MKVITNRAIYDARTHKNLSPKDLFLSLDATSSNSAILDFQKWFNKNYGTPQNSAIAESGVFDDATKAYWDRLGSEYEKGIAGFFRTHKIHLGKKGKKTPDVPGAVAATAQAPAPTAIGVMSKDQTPIAPVPGNATMDASQWKIAFFVLLAGNVMYSIYNHLKKKS